MASTLEKAGWVVLGTVGAGLLGAELIGINAVNEREERLRSIPVERLTDQQIIDRCAPKQVTGAVVFKNPGLGIMMKNDCEKDLKKQRAAAQKK